MKIKVLCFLVGWVLGIGGLGAQGVVDSLERILDQPIDDSLRVVTLNWLSVYTKDTDANQALLYARDAEALSMKIGDIKWQSISLSNLGGAYLAAGKLREAEGAMVASLERSKSIGYAEGVSDGYGNLGAIYNKKGRNEEALTYVMKANRMRDSLGLVKKLGVGYNNLSNIYADIGNFNKAVATQKQSLVISKELGDSAKMAMNYSAFVRLYGMRGKLDSSNYYLQLGLPIYESLGMKSKVAVLAYNGGHIQFQLGDFKAAAAYYGKARELFEEIGNKSSAAQATASLGMIWHQFGEYEAAFEALDAAIKYFEETDMKGLLLNLYTNYANVLYDYNDSKGTADQPANLDAVLDYHKKAMEISIYQKKPLKIALTKGNVGTIYWKQGKYDQAVKYLEESIKLNAELGAEERSVNHFVSLGKCYLKLGETGKAIKYLEQAKELNEANSSFPSELFRVLAKAYHAQGNPNKAYEHLQNAIELTDSTFVKEKLAAISEIETKYQTEKKELQNQALQLENELQAKANRNQRLVLGGLSLGLAALAGLSLFLYRQRQRIQAQKAEIELLNREQRHRMMNNLVFANSLMGLQVKRLEEQPEARQAVKEAEARLRAMSALHRRLHHEGEGQKSIGLHGYLKEITAALQGSFSTTGQPLTIELHGPEGTRVDGEAAMRIGLIVNELATNSCKHAFAEQPQPQIDVHLIPEGEGRYRLIYTDNGSGLPADFEIDTQKSMGLYLIHNLVKQLNGRIAFSGESGTRVECELNLETV